MIAAGETAKIVAISIACADRHDLDPLLTRSQCLLDCTLRGVGITVGQDHDVPLSILRDELATRHLGRISQVGTPFSFETVNRGVKASYIVGRRRLQGNQRRKRNETNLGCHEVALRQKFPRRRLSLDQRGTRHAGRNIDQQ